MKKWIVDGKFKELSDDEVKALSTEDLGEYTSAKHANDSESLITRFENKFKELKKDFLTTEEVEKITNDFKASVKGLPMEDLKKYVETIENLQKGVTKATEAAEEIKEICIKQDAQLKAVVEKGRNAIPDVRRKSSREDHIKALITNSMNSVEFTEFKNRGFGGSTVQMYLDQKDDKVVLRNIDAHKNPDNNEEIKATVDTSSHTGTVMISDVSDIVRDDSPTRRTHVRDLMNVGMTDQAQIVAGQVYDYSDALTLGAVMLSENGEAPESVFKSKEETWGIKRIANAIRLSKREIKVNGLQFVLDKVLSKLPDATLFVEDHQLLFGDGVSNNVQGLSGKAQPFDLSGNVYAATAFASVASYNSGTQSLVTFAAVHNLKNGDDLTIAVATHAGYNTTHESIEVVNTKQVILDVAYVVEADTSAWTGTSKSGNYQTVDGAQEYDVLSVAIDELEAGEYKTTGIILNTKQGGQMGRLKDTQENYLNINKDASGKVTNVNGIPIAYTTAMPYGKWINGDFSRNGLELKEFTPLNIQFKDDVESAKKNEIVLIIEEEIIFPIYNPFWFIYGKFSTAKTQLETPA